MKKLQWAHPMYYISLVYLVFPFGGIILWGYPEWTFWLTLAFVCAYLYIIHFDDKVLQTVAWYYLLAYIVYMTLQINVNMIWFAFYPVNLLIYRFEARLKSWPFITYLGVLAFLVVEQLLFSSDISVKVFVLVVSAFILAWLYFLYQEREKDKYRQESEQKNAYINLLMAENERNRIGRDLHDTLGHVFAMMTLKTELALKQLEKGQYDFVQRELKELQQTSRSSMQDVRQIVNNLKFRTASEELAHLQEMFAMTSIDFQLHHDLDLDSLSPVMQSTMTMILRELTNNVVKHSQAKSCQIDLYEENGLVIKVKDDGCGFGDVTGKELTSIRERLLLVKGRVDIVSSQNPTIVQVWLEETKEK